MKAVVPVQIKYGLAAAAAQLSIIVRRMVADYLGHGTLDSGDVAFLLIMK
jgi:hypothetical protein